MTGRSSSDIHKYIQARSYYGVYLLVDNVIPPVVSCKTAHNQKCVAGVGNSYTPAQLLRMCPGAVKLQHDIVPLFALFRGRFG